MKMGYHRREKTTRREVGRSVHENVVPGTGTLGTAERGMSSPAEFWHPGPGCQREDLVTGVTESAGVVERMRAAPTRLFNGEPRVAAKRSGACIRSSSLQGSNTTQPERNNGNSPPGHRIIMKELPGVKEDSGHGITRSTFSNGNPWESRVAPAGYAARDRRGTGSENGTVTTLSRSCWLVLVLVLGSGCHMLNAQDVAPSFRSGGQSHVLQVLQGNRVVLSCPAQGSWPLQYSWRHNGSNISSSSLDTLSIPAVSRSSAGWYQCVVRNRAGALLHTRIELQVAYLGQFRQEEQKKSVSVGRAAVLPLPPLSSSPPPLVTWYKDGHKIIPSSREVLTLDGQLLLLCAGLRDTGTYQALVLNHMTGESLTSPAVLLSITGKKNRGSTEPDSQTESPVIVIGPRNTSVVVGSEATLECVANTRHMDRLVLTWKRNGRRLTNGVGSYGRRLTLPSSAPSDGGVYVCEASLTNSSARPVEARAHLSVLEPPYFTSEPRRRILVEVEKSVDIHCHAKGTPAPRVEWYKDAVPLSQLANPRYKITTATNLTVRRVQPGDGGVFQCFARNTAGERETHTHLVVTNVAPTFTLPPSDITVTNGNIALLTCQATGAPNPSITWKRGSQVLASGVVQIPRFMLLESGDLQIQPISFQDSGNYTCIASNTEGTINHSCSLTVWSETVISVPPSDQRVIKGTTATLLCNATHDPRVNVSYQWLRGDAVLQPSSGGRVSVSEGSLTISHTWSGDIGDYSCRVSSPAGNSSHTARLEVIELPHSPRSLQSSLNDSNSRSALLSWLRPFDGNSPLLHYILELSENNSPWKVYLPDVDPAVTQVSVGGLTPARTYQFRLCAVNQVGRGQYSAETQRLMLREEAPSAPPKNMVASGRSNQSIMVQWQPPPDTQLNGVLKGYVLRYRLAGLPGDFQEKQLTSPETSHCLLKDLIIWTQYQIQLAAYNAAGLGVFTSPVTEYTLQGVPTAPPQDVQIQAESSSSVRFSWKPPPQQFINGINQGYKLMVWPEFAPDDVTVVTITPDFPGSRHTGLVSGLRKFTWYLGSALCFTTPGDGPASPAQLLQTHADTPGPVLQLSFSEILDTSVQVSWAEPNDKNGIITGYVLSWQVSGVNSSREERSLSNSTLHYKITGLTSTTSYTLEVVAVTAAGRGVATSSTISSGVPPVLPGAPSHLVISNISPRSATVRFRPSNQLNTAVSKWIVEGQVGVPGAEPGEGWEVLYEEENQSQPDALEVPDLIPFTYYRFRVRQQNVLGSGPSSAPSRLLQTLQDSPDTAPRNLTLLSTSPTSFLLRWTPVPQSRYNGDPDTVGYRVCVRQADGEGEERLEELPRGSEVEGQEKEVHLEGLKPWTEYLLQVHIYNSVGAGPWSAVVSGRTQEAAPSGFPGNVSVEAVSSTSILVTWSAVAPHLRNGVILGYKVLYREQASPAPPSEQRVEGGAGGAVVLGGLQKYSLYQIQVLAFTRTGDGPPSQPVSNRTRADVPGPPVRLMFPEVQLTSVRVVWLPPTQPNGIILGYQVWYQQQPGPASFTVVEVGSTARHFTVSGLQPQQSYVFRLAARTALGWGPCLEALVLTTEHRERPQSPRKLFAPQQEVESRRLRVHWLAVASGSSPVRYFSLQIRKLPEGEWTLHSAHIPHNLTAWTVERLHPFTSYQLRMQATNDVGDSAPSRESDAITTLQDVPEESPIILAVSPSTTTSVLVQWQRPSGESVNGVLVGYRIYYRELPVNSTMATDAMTTNSSNSSTRASITARSTFKTVSSASLTEFELTQLKKFRRYQIAMTTYNIVGESPPSAPVEVLVGEAAPSLPPQSIRVVSADPGSLLLSWEPPPSHTQNGDILGYKVHYWERERQNQTEKVQVVFVPETSLHLVNLTSYTAHMVTLTAFTTAGDGPASEPQGARTLQTAPSQPSFLSFSEVTGWSANLSWGTPASPNGLLEGYRVVYQPCVPVHGVTRQVTVDVKGSWQRWLKVRELNRGVAYTFSVQARTVSYGPPLLANLTSQPLNGTPGSPLEMSITRTSSALTIHWLEGSAGAGPIIGYVIEARPSDEGVWDSFVRLLPPSSRSVSVAMDRLRSGVGYEFRVIAVNRYGYGEPSTPSSALAALTERPFYEQWWFLLVLALVGLILVLMLVFTLLLHGHNHKYHSCSTNGKHVQPTEESVTLDNGGFTSLELNSRSLNTKNSFLKKNGTRSPPRPSPGGLHYSDEDVTYNGAVLTESTMLTEKTAELSGSELSDSDYEDELPKHSFVNHYMSDPTYFNSWKRARGQQGVQQEHPTVVTQHPSGGAYTPGGQPAHTHPSTNPQPGSRTPVTGFSSFV